MENIANPKAQQKADETIKNFRPARSTSNVDT